MKQLLPPGPRPDPVVGNLLAFRRDPLQFFTACAQEYGEVAHFRILNAHAYLLSNPDHIESVLVRNSANFIKGRVFRSNRLLLGDGLLTSEGGLWRRQRRLAQPAFHKDRVSSYMGTIQTLAESMAAGWRDGEVRDVYQEMKGLALKIIARILFDVDVASDADEVSSALRAAWEEFTARIQSGLLIPESVPTRGNLRFQRAVGNLDRVIRRIIEERRMGRQGGGDCLSLLLEAQDSDGSQMTDTQLRDEVMTLLVAGHESTALALTWTWYLLARNPEKAEPLYAEADALGREALSVRGMAGLPYSEMVVKEALRLYPPVWAIPRQAVKDCEIGGYSVPAGTSLTISQWVMHRHPHYFAEPASFRPERWADGLEKQLPDFVYFPFGGGPRHCIAYSLAMVEAVLVMAILARTFEFSVLSEPPAVAWPSITLYPRYGIRARIQRRGH